MVSIQNAGNRLCPHGGHTGPGDWPRPNGRYKAEWNGHTTTAAIQGPRERIRPNDGLTRPRGTATPPLRPYGDQESGHAPTAALRGPGDRPRSHGAIRVPRELPRRHDNHTGPTGPATSPRRPHGARGKPPSTAATGSRGQATTPRRPHRAQVTGHSPTAATR